MVKLTAKEFRELSQEEILEVARNMKDYEEMTVKELKEEAFDAIWCAADAIEMAVRKYDGRSDDEWADDMETAASVVRRLTNLAHVIDEDCFKWHREDE